MAFDAHANLASTLLTNSPGVGGTSFTVTTGTGALFPAAPFNCLVCPASTLPTTTNAEIVRVTVVSGDTLTCTRAQESTSAMNVVAGYVISNAITNKVITDIENATSGGYTLPAATNAVLGGVIVPASGNLSVDGSGNISVPKATNAVFGVVEVDNSTITAAAGVITAASTTIAGTVVAPGGSITLDTLTGLSTVGPVYRSAANTLANAKGTAYNIRDVPFIIATNGTATLAITSTAASIWGSATPSRNGLAFDATGFSQARVIVTIGATASNATTSIGVRYGTSSSTVFANYSAAGAASADVAVTLNTTVNTIYVGSWTNLAAGAAADVFWCIFGVDTANASLLPTISQMHVQFR